MTNIVLVLASAGIGLIAQHGIRDHAMLLVSAALILLGGYGAITSLKYRERYELHISQAVAMRHRLDTMYPQLRLEEGLRGSGPHTASAIPRSAGNACTPADHAARSHRPYRTRPDHHDRHVLTMPASRGTTQRPMQPPGTTGHPSTACRANRSSASATGLRCRPTRPAGTSTQERVSSPPL
jgi:hypothetical protein